MDLIFGLVTGVVFGVLLQRSEVIRYDRQLGALLFKDMTIVKFMLTTVLVGMVGVHLLVDLGLAKPSIKPLILGGTVLGGLIFGAGWGLLGYCPGTSAGALGEGRLDSLPGIAGMLLGAALFAETYPTLKATVLTWGDYGKVTLPQLMEQHHWVLIPWFCLLGYALLRWIHKRGL